MYYERRNIEQGWRRVVLIATQVLHKGDVVSHSDGFGTAANRTLVGRIIMSINFWTSWSRLVLGHPFCWNCFIRHRELHDFKVAMVYSRFVFFKDSPIITAIEISLQKVFH